MDGDSTKEHDGHLPHVVKFIILIQAAIILSFTVGFFQEYADNLYLQQYVISLVKSNIVADAILSMVTVSVFAVGTFTIIGSMYSTKKLKQWTKLSQEAQEASSLPVMPILETVEPRPRSLRARRQTRQRKPKVNSDDLYHSMTRYAEKNQE